MAEESLPDIFTDGVSVNAGPYGVTLTLHLSHPDAQPSESPGPAVARIRMNAELAEALSGILTKVVEIHQQQSAERVAADIPADVVVKRSPGKGESS